MCELCLPRLCTLHPVSFGFTSYDISGRWSESLLEFVFPFLCREFFSRRSAEWFGDFSVRNSRVIVRFPRYQLISERFSANWGPTKVSRCSAKVAKWRPNVSRKGCRLLNFCRLDFELASNSTIQRTIWFGSPALKLESQTRHTIALASSQKRSLQKITRLSLWLLSSVARKHFFLPINKAFGNGIQGVQKKFALF